jgi:hypothetical protein
MRLRHARTPALVALIAASLIILISCAASLEVGEAGMAAGESAAVLVEQADALEAAGDVETAEKYRDWAVILASVSDKIEDAVADGVIDEADAMTAIAPYLEADEATALEAALTLTGQWARGEEVGAEGVIATLQQGAVLIPGYGALAASLLGIGGAFFRQRRGMDSIVEAVNHHIGNGGAESWEAAESEIKAIMGERARGMVAKAKTRIARRKLKAQSKADMKARKAGTAL